MKLVSIITVNYNHSYLTDALIASIFERNIYKNIEIIVVDNASDINPIPEWKKKYKDVTFVHSEKNLGFAGGNNLGVQHAKGEYLFFVNNDTEFTERLILSMLVYMNMDSNIGVASPKICYFDKPDTLQYAGYTKMNYFTCRNACIGQYKKDKGQYDNLTGKTGYAHGAAMMTRRSVIEKVGLMDENYFLYYEELDWCERIKKAGYSVSLNMQAVIYHKESMSVGKKTGLKEYFMNRNRILFIRKHTNAITCCVFYCYFLGIVMPKNILGYIKAKQYALISIFFKALWWNMTHKEDSKDLVYKGG